MHVHTSPNRFCMSLHQLTSVAVIRGSSDLIDDRYIGLTAVLRALLTSWAGAVGIFVNQSTSPRERDHFSSGIEDRQRAETATALDRVYEAIVLQKEAAAAANPRHRTHEKSRVCAAHGGQWTMCVNKETYNCVRGLRLQLIVKRFYTRARTRM